ncbi:hypothetical protein GOBAR_AA31973 [Gossypium barbadense]|uniref:Uncharacterized protein n=1 Tax=Gossypium barbadense TaxID=3634 RepID=A0A2P5WCA0_GOSBA|nr:hypothetical protein GOBAR_AA31973 [Gossypium barbadense]
MISHLPARHPQGLQQLVRSNKKNEPLGLQPEPTFSKTLAKPLESLATFDTAAEDITSLRAANAVWRHRGLKN